MVTLFVRFWEMRNSADPLAGVVDPGGYPLAESLSRCGAVVVAVSGNRFAYDNSDRDGATSVAPAQTRAVGCLEAGRARRRSTHCDARWGLRLLTRGRTAVPVRAIRSIK